MEQQLSEKQKVLLDKLLNLSKEELAKNFVSTIQENSELKSKVNKLESIIGLKSQEELSLGVDHYLLNRELFGKSSEKTRSDKAETKKKKKNKKPKAGKPSSRWPEMEMVAENDRDLKSEVQSSKVLHADETPWKMMEGSEKKSWYLWGYFNQRSAFYKAHDSRSKKAANDVIKGSNAKYLVVDGYTAYNQPSKAKQIEIANCWAHARRKFYKIKDLNTDAKEMITLIATLYQIEDELENKDFDQRKNIRQTKSKEAIDKIREHLHSIKTLPKSELGKAQSYMMKYWLGLVKVLDDPDIPLDNNHAERSLRGPVLGRKNYFGNHSPRGAETAAILLSICESCKLNKVDPKKYFKWATAEKQDGKRPLTPYHYSQLTEQMG